MEMMIAFQTWETRTWKEVRNRSLITQGSETYLGLVLHLHLGGSKELSVDTLREACVDLTPWGPDRQTQRERPSDGEYDDPDDVP